MKLFTDTKTKIDYTVESKTSLKIYHNKKLFLKLLNAHFKDLSISYKGLIFENIEIEEI